jgi:hypothetical protein
MSDMVPGTLVDMRIMKRFAHYTVGDRIAVPMDQAQDLAARRLAQPMQLLVPTPVEASAESKPADPIRQPAQVVRK